MSKRFALLWIVGALLCSAIPVRSQSTLPDGNGKETVQATCSQCHTLTRVINAGYGREGWRNVVAMMMNAGAHVPADQVAPVVEYLTKNFPERTKPVAVTIPGSLTVSIKEWIVPTPGSRPHDPLATADGAIWYTGQMANVLGRLDPKTGSFKEYRAPVPDSGPHGLVADNAGDIWFTANFKGYIGRLEPKTSTFTEYRLPDPAARDPHTPIFDQKGTLWFTVQNANMIGKLVPQTREIKLVNVPTPHAQPYGMVVSSQGVPYFAEFGTNKLASIDPQTLAIKEYSLPNPQTRPRRIAIDENDVLWYTDYARGYLGRFDPKTGTTTEWPSPGGASSLPYGIAILKNAVWYSESGVTPNTLVRFDPTTKKFQTWPIPSGGGVIRNMMPTPDGNNLVLACSGVNRVALVQVR